MPEAFSLDDSPDLAAAAENLADNMPPPQEHAIAAASEGEESPTAEISTAPAHQNGGTSAPPSSTKTDKFGVPFDPEKHTGSLLKSGHWREKKAKAAPASQLNIPGGKKPAATAAQKSTALTPEEKNARALNAGRVAASVQFQIGQMFGGKEFAPDSPEELDFYSKAWADYLVTKETPDLPPGVVLLGMLVAYPASRANRPETAAKISRARSWLALRITAWKLKREYKKRGIVARVEIKDGVLLVDGKAQQ